MKIFFMLFLLTCAMEAAPAFAQLVNFKDAYRKSNPVDPNSSISVEEVIKIHQQFLDQAIQAKNTEKQLYGFGYLSTDYRKANNYAEAAKYLVEAEGIAQASGKPGWLGWVNHRKGALFINLKNFQRSIPCFEAARDLCGQAHDSLCLAETLEQLGAAHSRLGDFQQAHFYYELAMPLIEQYGSELQLATTLNNFANLVSDQHKFAEAIQYYERAIILARKVGNKKEEIIYLNNLASTYNELGQFDTALKLLKQCVVVNLENGWLLSAIDNYAALSQGYEGIGNYHLAFNYLQKSYALKDSLIGVETQDKIAALESKYQSQQKELELQKSQASLAASRYAFAQLSWILTVFIVSALLGIWRWRVQTHRTIRERKENKENLSVLTGILLHKNSLLAKMEGLVSESHSQNSPLKEVSNFEDSLLNQRILTPADWEGFKVYFEKAYPGYLFHLRTAFPTLSDAEKRLFLFIKLKLTTREAAAILGISVDSVKKTRNRLRHRLELGEETELEVFIRAF